jgi:hypothetical protein
MALSLARSVASRATRQASGAMRFSTAATAPKPRVVVELISDTM